MRAPAPLLVALLGLAALGATERLLVPEVVSLADVGRHEGARVAIEGFVASTHAGARGSVTEVTDGAVRLPVLASGPPPALRGSHVRAIGVVARQESGFILSAERVVVLDAPRGGRPVREALEFLADGLPLVASGTHVRGVLRDGDAGLPLAFEGEAAPEGPLTASGVVRLDRARAAYRLDVREWAVL